MKDPFAPLSVEGRRRLRKRKHPDWVQPMLATLTDEPFSDPGWIYEPKLDGVRCLAFRDGDRVRLLSRNRKIQNAFYPELVEGIAAQTPRDFVVDGEVVAFRDSVTSFSRLQQRMKIADPGQALRSRVPVYYYLFDIVHLDGRDTTRLDLRDRKSLLEGAIEFRDPLRFSSHRNAEGEAYLAEACRKGWEGLIAKRADSTYDHPVPAEGKHYLPVQCQQCDAPPCVDVCPVEATWKESDGIVVVDYNWCIGCRYCEAACPYHARRFNWKKPEIPAAEVNPNQGYLSNRIRPQGVMEKCTFCLHRVREGRLPACLEACPTGARVFGNVLDPKSEIRWVLDNKRVFVLKEELGTRPRFFYFFDK